jgi:hypothetical protein
VRTILNVSDFEDSFIKIPKVNNIIDKVVLNKHRNQIVGLLKVRDDMYRLHTYEKELLYD